MCQSANYDHGPGQVRRVIGDDHKSINHKKEQQNQAARAEKSQFFTNDGKYHIILSFGNKTKLLDTVTQSFSEESAGANGI